MIGKIDERICFNCIHTFFILQTNQDSDDLYNSELRIQKLFIRPYTHLQNKVQCMNNNVYIMYIWVKETLTSTKTK